MQDSGTIDKRYGGKSTMDVVMQTPAEVAQQLEGAFTQEQAESIAEYVYQPLLKELRF